MSTTEPATTTTTTASLERVALHVRYRAVVGLLPRVTEPEARVGLLADIAWPRRPLREASEQAARERLGLC